MLQAINDRIKGWLGIAVVVLIGLPFALWGVQSYFEDAGPRYAAKVNGSEITASEFERSVSLQRQSILRQNGGKLPMAESALRERTLTQMINQRLLEEITFENGYRISDTTLSQRIEQMFTVDGMFDRERFEASVLSLGMNVPMYENALRSELRLQQMQAAIANTSFVTKDAVKKLAALSEQTRDISVLTFNVDHFSTATKANAEEIKTYYEKNLQRFMVPEKIKVDYVEITSDVLAGDIDIDEQQIKKMYDDYVVSVTGREERKASHILIQNSDDKAAAQIKIESLKKELEQGADFAEMAKKHSQDPGSAVKGGDLDWVALGEMVKPFEKALFDMKKGSVSEVVKTQFGYHLIKLDDIRSEPIVPLGVKRYEFEDEIKEDGVASKFYDLSERLAATAYENPDSLDVVIDDLGLKINTSDYFSRVAGEGIAKNEKVRNIAFSALVLAQGSNSDIIELSPTHVVVVRLNEHVQATAIPLADVSSKIENILKVQGGHKQTMAAALDIKVKIEAGESIDSMKGKGVNIVTIASLGRRDNARVSDPSILRNAFDLVPTETDKKLVKEVNLASGDVALVVLNQINLSDNILQSQLDLVKSEALREHAIRDFSSALLIIKENAVIDRNMKLVNNADE
ncbi:Peptidyl-prolyl cis-trans isomerase PpiD [hydrothermal vent metagenome]|uniref:Periplasmic chaperone PpiD n=1 Tax=hydrothermal vent metagenome TaxID=652676 RepID=A0A3B0WLZ9_9ZZZZ